ncbi:long-chain fatty acid transport protein 4-like isoform X1 [Metopolophium dirhodum]|uniref:long-chain fatty acid transport protein 4-like isoform X1 n=1 Tax=Metopolophium dirhodum TaxID=44670 RepID=UPI00298F50B7|nr:long-chain fatty acid transport protein 4-like isoform X1 [Metopolophium dirhodum]
MNKDNQHSVAFVSFTAVTAVAVLLITLKYCILYVVTILSAVWLIINYWNFLVRVWQTLPRDAILIKDYSTYFIKIRIWNLLGCDTYAKIFKRNVEKHPNKIAFKHEGSTWRYIEVEELSNQIANYFKEQGLKRGDIVALYMESCPEYVCIWLGLSKIGVIVALINNNLRADTLAHSIKVSNCSAVIIGKEQINALVEVINTTTDDKLNDMFTKSNVYIKNYIDDTTSLVNTSINKAINLDYELKEISKSAPVKDISEGSSKDQMLYIYTSGTTGMPKAAIMTQSRAIYMAMGAKHIAGITEYDVVYTPLPLYHTAGGILGVSSVLLGGSTCVIRSKFSASNYWTDCLKYECTVAQYIGEMCRYCLASPPSDADKTHQVRLILGNGLRPQIWNDFITRFNIKKVAEFYGATEGNANMMNTTNKVGAVGFIPFIGEPFYPVTLIRVDPDTNEPIRGKNNLCIKCQVGEPGLLVGKIRKTTENSFSGYVEKSASEKKIIQDVFSKGDKVFNSGDVLIRDEHNFFYFKDRTGDTFRWKGENVSTSEVEAAISNIVKLKDCLVYGVEVPNTEGKAGMVAIVDETSDLDLDKLSAGINKSLPAYARPLFLRVVKTPVSLTGTFKMKKNDVQNDGFDPTKVAEDPLYFNEGRKFVPLTQELRDSIVNGEKRL